jgi:hypothetical protein
MHVDLLTGLTAIALALAGVVATYVDSASQIRPKAEVNVRGRCRCGARRRRRQRSHGAACLTA